jgi:hypothetical protein
MIYSLSSMSITCAPSENLNYSFTIFVIKVRGFVAHKVFGAAVSAVMFILEKT